MIVFQPDLGTAIACAAITICVLFVAGLELKYLAYAFVGSLLPLYFLIFHVAYRRDRILAFLNPYSDPQGKGFHIIQSLIAVSTGGLTGVGLMEGKEKAVLSSRAAHGLHLFRTGRRVGAGRAAWPLSRYSRYFSGAASRTALRTPDLFGRFLAIGITSMVVVQAFINISVVLGLMPTKGIPLPLISYGGSSLFITLGCIGVLLNITKQAE